MLNNIDSTLAVGVHIAGAIFLICFTLGAVFGLGVFLYCGVREMLKSVK